LETPDPTSSTDAAAAAAAAAAAVNAPRKITRKRSRLLPYTYYEALDASITANKLNLFCTRLLDKVCQLEGVKRKLTYDKEGIVLHETPTAHLQPEASAKDARKASQVIAYVVSQNRKLAEESIISEEGWKDDEEMNSTTGEEGVPPPAGLSGEEEEEEKEEEKRLSLDDFIDFAFGQAQKEEEVEEKKKKKICINNDAVHIYDDDDDDELADLPTRRSRRIRRRNKGDAGRFLTSSETDGETEGVRGRVPRLATLAAAAATATPAATEKEGEKADVSDTTMAATIEEEEEEENWEQSQSLI